MAEIKDLHWKVNTVGLLQEILHNNGTSVLQIPLNIFKDILAQVANRATQLNDPELNGLMCRLALYESSEPNSDEYDSKLTNKTIEDGHKASLLNIRRP